MEIYAGFGEYADSEISRLIDAIEDLGQLDNTLIFYIVGDNGTSAEGGMNGLFNEYSYFNGVPESVEDILKHYDELGGPHVVSAHGRRLGGGGRCAVRLDQAGRLRFRRHAQRHGGALAEGHQSEGGNPHAVSPRDRHRPHDSGSGRICRSRSRSMAPCKRRSKACRWCTPSTTRRRRPSTPRSTSRSSATARSITTAGWPAPCIAPAWDFLPKTTLEKDMWELYDTRTDFSCANNLADKNPAKLKELQELFLKEAVKYQVLPLDDRVLERTNAELVGRPELMEGRTSLTLYPGMKGMTENVFINLKNKSHAITAELEIPEQGRQRRDPRPGRPLRRLELVPRRMASRSTPTTSSGWSDTR